jgi:hypothetical protein
MLIDLAVFPFTHRQRFTGWAISTTSFDSLPNAIRVPGSACSLPGTCFKPRCISLYYLCRDLSPRWPPTTSPTASAIRPMLFDLVVFTSGQHNFLHSPSANAIPAAAGSTAGTCFKSRCISSYYICRDLTASAIRPMLNDFVVFTTIISSLPNANAMPAIACLIAGIVAKLG